MLQDLRHAFRALRRRPLLSAAAILSLSLGIGVNSAIFSVFDRLILRKLPVASPEQIVVLNSPGRKPGSTSAGDSGGSTQVFSYPLFRDLERLQTKRLSGIAAHRDFDANLAFDGHTTRADGLLVSGSYFPVLRVSPALGRLLTVDDDRALGANPVVVLSHRYWTTRFASDPAVIGKALTVNGEPLTIVGVAPEGFSGTTTMDYPDVFVPLTMTERVHAWRLTRLDHWLYLFARLTPGFTREQAQEELRGPFTALMRDAEFPAMRTQLRDSERTAFLARRLLLAEGAHGRQQSRDQVRVLMTLLFAVTGLVLLIACANVANLLLARATDRAGELSVRLSLGASAAGLVRLLFMESLLLGLVGATGALLVARATTGLLLGMLPSEDAAVMPFELNGAMVLFTMALGVGTALLFGLFPAVHGVRRRTVPGAWQQAGRASATRGSARFRSTLATAQIALATALLATATLFATSLANVTRVPLGLDRDRLVTFRLSPYLNGYTADEAHALFERVADALREVPSVTGVTASTIPVLADEGWSQNVTVEGVDVSGESLTSVSTMRIDTEYFRTLGIPLVAGREFMRLDTRDAPKVAIVNQAFVRQFGLGQAAIGRRLALGAGNRLALDIEIIGIAADAKYSNVRDTPPAQLFMPYRQAPVGPLTFYARASSDLRSALGAIPPLVARIDPNLPVEQLRTLDDQIRENVARDRVLATLSSSFGALAVLLAAIGLYAVLAFMVAQRVKEFGIRMAVGAAPADLRRLIAGHVSRIAVAGIVVGLATAVMLGRLGQSMLFGVNGTDPRVLGGTVAAMAVIAILAAVVPARRAMRVAPGVALRID